MQKCVLPKSSSRRTDHHGVLHSCWRVILLIWKKYRILYVYGNIFALLATLQPFGILTFLFSNFCHTNFLWTYCSLKENYIKTVRLRMNFKQIVDITTTAVLPGGIRKKDLPAKSSTDQKVELFASRSFFLILIKGNKYYVF